ncbi:MAG: DNA/RNA non-specific endonuclease [Hyphomicrobiales bacterium]
MSAAAAAEDLLAELRAENERLMQERPPEPSAEADGDAALHFVDRLARSGTALADPRERRAAQAMINFWVAELITRGAVDEDFVAPRLAKPAEEADAADAEADAARSIAPEPDPQLPNQDGAALKRARTLVQIAATARRWQDSGDPGWLLSKSALKEAERFEDEDESIGELVSASRSNIRRIRRYRALIAVFVVVLGFALGGLSLLYRELLETQHVVRSRNAALERQTTQNSNMAQQLRAAALHQQVVDRERQLQFYKLQSLLREVAPIVRAARDDGRIPEIPSGLLPYVDDTPVRLPPLPEGVPLRGYDPDFLTGDILSKASAPPVPMPHASGAADLVVPYLNYSVAMDATRRLPRVAAVTIRRSGLIALQSVNAVLQPDPRLPAEQQADPRWFRDGLAAGQLVNAREIAWGDGFPTDAAAAGRRAYAMVATTTNATPQFEAFDGGPWVQAETYAREAFAPGADRIIVFSGPLLRPDDPTSASGARIPRSFWKVMVAANPDDPTTPRVEAYLLPQYGADGAPVGSGTRFDRPAMAVPLAQLAALTGLDFGSLLDAADKGTVTRGGGQPDLAAALADIETAVGPDAGRRRAAMQQVLNALRAPLAPDDRRRLATAIIARTSGEAFRLLSPPARVNVATLIATVPKEWWDSAGWIDLKAAARRAVGDAVATLGGCAGGDTCAQLVIAEQRLDWSIAANRIVYVQFAGMARSDVQALSARLKLLGWTLPGEERTPAAAGLDEVRYAATADDQRAAELLAADYRALGQDGVKAVPNPQVKRGIIEVWLSR